MTGYSVDAALASERVGPAVRAVLAVLLDGPKPQGFLADIGAVAGGVQPKTVANQLGHLSRAGFLWAKGSQGARRTWGLTPFGEDLARSLG